MNNSINFKNLNNILLYKKAFDKFININKIKINNISDIDYLIPILFLTEMNRYCKKNNIQIHGYYISTSLMNIFNKIVEMVYFDKEIQAIEIINLIKNISINVEYLNTRVDNNNKIKKKINYNYHNFIIELSKNLEELISYKKNFNKSNVSIRNKKYDENVFSKFFFILLMIAKYIGSGEYDEPNLIKLGQYYSNIFIIYLRLLYKINDNKNETDSISMETESRSNLTIMEKFLNHKTVLLNSIINLQIHSDTIDEIIEFIENEIIIIIKEKVEKDV